MHIHLSEHFSYAKLLRFTFPTVVMLIFTSIYGVVDGVFVSNYAGKTAFAAVNLIMPPQGRTPTRSQSPTMLVRPAATVSHSPSLGRSAATRKLWNIPP